MDELIAALKTALSMEKSGYDLYMKAAKNTENKLGKATIEAIAKKELDHIKAIEEFAGHNFDKALASVNPKDKKDYVVSVMNVLKDELDTNVKKDSDLEKAYQAAMKLEKSAFAFYKDLNTKANDHKAKEFFAFLMKEEKAHYELFSETLIYLNDPGIWYREQERWVVEG